MEASLWSRSARSALGITTLPAVGYGVEAPWTVPPEAWMVLPLPAYEPGARGVVTYAQAFAAVV